MCNIAVICVTYQLYDSVSYNLTRWDYSDRTPAINAHFHAEWVSVTLVLCDHNCNDNLSKTDYCLFNQVTVFVISVYL